MVLMAWGCHDGRWCDLKLGTCSLARHGVVAARASRGQARLHTPKRLTQCHATISTQHLRPLSWVMLGGLACFTRGSNMNHILNFMDEVSSTTRGPTGCYVGLRITCHRSTYELFLDHTHYLTKLVRKFEFFLVWRLFLWSHFLIKL